MKSRRKHHNDRTQAEAEETRAGPDATHEDHELSGDREEHAPDLEERIRLTAYFCAERRGFAPGHELSDWLEAEAVVRGECE